MPLQSINFDIDEQAKKFASFAKLTLCNGGALYAPSSFASISNMLCEASVLARWGVGGGEQGGKNYFTTLFLGS